MTDPARTLRLACWTLPLIGVCIAAFLGFVTVAGASSPAEQAAGAALAGAVAVVPYVFARAMDAILRG